MGDHSRRRVASCDGWWVLVKDPWMCSRRVGLERSKDIWCACVLFSRLSLDRHRMAAEL